MLEDFEEQNYCFCAIEILITMTYDTEICSASLDNVDDWLHDCKISLANSLPLLRTIRSTFGHIFTMIFCIFVMFDQLVRLFLYFDPLWHDDMKFCVFYLRYCIFWLRLAITLN